MSSEHQTVDHTNKLMDHDTICVIRTACSTTITLGPGLIHHIIHHKRWSCWRTLKIKSWTVWERRWYRGWWNNWGSSSSSTTTGPVAPQRIVMFVSVLRSFGLLCLFITFYRTLFPAFAIFWLISRAPMWRGQASQRRSCVGFVERCGHFFSIFFSIFFYI